MTRQVPTRRLTRTDAVDFLKKAEEFLEAARQALQEGRTTACASCAAHAGINASDAITGFVLGKRSAGKSHDQVLTLLKEVPRGKEASSELGPLLRLKPKAEYEPGPVRRDAAARAVQRAERLVEIARNVGERTDA